MQVESGEPEIIERVAALDVGKAEVVCCARVPGPGGQRMQEGSRHLHDDGRAARLGGLAGRPGRDPGGDGGDRCAASGAGRGRWSASGRRWLTQAQGAPALIPFPCRRSRATPPTNPRSRPRRQHTALPSADSTPLPLARGFRAA
jgi:hypothetical protein